MSKTRLLDATENAVGVAIRKSVILNEGPKVFEDAWKLAEEQVAAEHAGSVVREIVFVDLHDELLLTFLLAEVK